MAKITAQDLKQYEANLLSIREKLSEEVNKIKDGTLNQSAKDSSGDLSGYSLHMADQASDNYDREFLLSLASNEQDILYKIDEALKRIADKTYGICSECDKPIAKARLKAVPFAEFCISCQEDQEKHQ